MTLDPARFIKTTFPIKAIKNNLKRKADFNKIFEVILCSALYSNLWVLKLELYKKIVIVDWEI